MPRITKLILLNGDQLCEWIDATGCYSCFDDARRAIADWADCSLSEVEEIETAGGEFIAVDGEPVAYLMSRFVPHPAAPVRGPVVDLRPLMAAE